MDLQPLNIFVSQASSKVTGFGLSGVKGQHRGLKSRRGLLECTAPELLQGQHPSEKSDNWAVGAITYWMHLGRFPFQGETGGMTGLAGMHACA